jgi:hypothetical protein
MSKRKLRYNSSSKAAGMGENQTYSLSNITAEINWKNHCLQLKKCTWILKIKMVKCHSRVLSLKT